MAIKSEVFNKRFIDSLSNVRVFGEMPWEKAVKEGKRATGRRGFYSEPGSTYIDLGLPPLSGIPYNPKLASYCYSIDAERRLAF